MTRITLPADGRPGGSAARADFLAGEEPLGIRVDGTALTMTMRTPGDDLELAAGFLVSEAVIRSAAGVANRISEEAAWLASHTNACGASRA